MRTTATITWVEAGVSQPAEAGRQQQQEEEQIRVGRRGGVVTLWVRVHGASPAGPRPCLPYRPYYTLLLSSYPSPPLVYPPTTVIPHLHCASFYIYILISYFSHYLSTPLRSAPRVHSEF